MDHPDGEARGAVERSVAWTEPFSGDDNLLRRWRSGDERAFDDLFLRYYRLVYRVLQGVVGSPQEAEDLAQETFLVLYRNPPRLEVAGFGPWLYRVAANRGYNALRRARQHKEQAITAGIATTLSQHDAWLVLWVGEALLAFAIVIAATVRKARAAGMPLFSTPARKFVLSFSPPLIAGAVFTLVLYQAGASAILPGMWLLLFGTGIVTGGAFSVKIVPVMGLCFMVLGIIALLCPASWTPWFMAAGFGVLNIIFGVLIARRHGG